jgi:sulfur relay (sulfurtransferase) DsrF/TusC family protein
LVGLTVNDGVFSLWNGQQALNSRPAYLSGTRAPTTSAISTLAISSSMKDCGILLIQSAVVRSNLSLGPSRGPI